MFTRTTLLLSGALALGACSHGTGAPQPTPIATPEGAVREFLAAVSDSNISRMANSWGNSNGPAAVTGEPDKWEQRLKIVQLYLRGGTWSLIDNKPEQGTDVRRDITMQFTRGDCVKQVPFVTVKSSHGGWLVQSVDVTAAGNPLTPCPTVGSGTQAPAPTH